MLRVVLVFVSCCLSVVVCLFVVVSDMILMYYMFLLFDLYIYVGSVFVVELCVVC